MDYTETLDKALYWLRELELDKALNLLYKLLEEHPTDLDLIQRIYPIEVKRPNHPGYQKICSHIFSIQSNTSDFHQLFIKTYVEFTQLTNEKLVFSKQQQFNLLNHLSQSHLLEDAEIFLEQIKKDYPEDQDTAQALFFYCESLINKKKFIQARKELKYLVTFYTETVSARNALARLKYVENTLENP
ncbi:tetratricopeptide repeat protein [Aliikangiella sp. IMCC44359]|uniref:tetratricopeptide repeat protein n=1 Tax=Aliikangiella sp. IMCC44359 TaxID=3459125 RepID=UPI00403AD162